MEAPAPPPASPPAAATTVYFGGPDMPPRTLRDLLKARIEAAPPGSEILWVTYYFRDMGLADALAAAQARGVRVRVALDARPRRSEANARVIARLSASLGDGLRLHRPVLPGLRLHAKIYAFSGPEPSVLVGSFNPSGDQPEDPAVLADIGDQDRGHNLLVEHRDPELAAAIRRYAERIWSGRGVSRLSLEQNRAVELKTSTLYFFPRLRPGVIERNLADVGQGDRIEAAVSHLKSGPFTAALRSAARRGARIHLVVHDTERRTPSATVEALMRAGIYVRRYCHPEGLPMHAKFVLVHRARGSSAWFGSFNFNASSRFLNREILLRSTDPALVSALQQRFAEIAFEAARLAERPARLATLDVGGARRSGAAAAFAIAPDRAC